MRVCVCACVRGWGAGGVDDCKALCQWSRHSKHTLFSPPPPRVPAGVPLSWFCTSRWLALLFLLLVNPVACLAGAAYLAAAGAPASSFPPDEDDVTSAAALSATKRGAGGQYAGGGSSGSGASGAARAAALYRELLLAPSHWLGTWRLNCVLVAWHAAAGGAPRDYALEDKALFLLEADRLGLPVAPFVKAPRVFVKHRSVEGGQVGRGGTGRDGARWGGRVGRAATGLLGRGGADGVLFSTSRPSRLSTTPPRPSKTPRASTSTTTSRPAATGSSQRRSTTPPASRACCRAGRRSRPFAS